MAEALRDMVDLDDWAALGAGGPLGSRRLLDGSGVYAGQGESSSRHSGEAVGKQSKGGRRSAGGQRKAGAVRDREGGHRMPRLDRCVIARILLKHTPLVYLALALLWMRIFVDLPHSGVPSVVAIAPATAPSSQRATTTMSGAYGGRHSLCGCRGYQRAWVDQRRGG
jgi:hypothetical protein